MEIMCLVWDGLGRDGNRLQHASVLCCLRDAKAGPGLLERPSSSPQDQSMDSFVNLGGWFNLGYQLPHGARDFL